MRLEQQMCRAKLTVSFCRQNECSRPDQYISLDTSLRLQREQIFAVLVGKNISNCRKIICNALADSQISMLQGWSRLRVLSAPPPSLLHFTDSYIQILIYIFLYTDSYYLQILIVSLCLLLGQFRQFPNVLLYISEAWCFLSRAQRSAIFAVWWKGHPYLS